MGEKFLRSLRVINQLLTAKIFLRFSIAASASRCIYCSRYLSCARRYSAEYFSPCAPHRSLREPLLQLRCHHLALATQLALAQKALFLRFSFSFTSLIPCPLPPRDEREKTERTTAQLPANKKCCLLIFAIAIDCLVVAAIPARNPRLSLSIIPNTIRGILAFPPLVVFLPVVWQITSSLSSHLVPLPLGCPALRGPRNARGVLGCTLRFRPREIPSINKKSP